MTKIVFCLALVACSDPAERVVEKVVYVTDAEVIADSGSDSGSSYDAAIEAAVIGFDSQCNPALEAGAEPECLLTKVPGTQPTTMFCVKEHTSPLFADHDLYAHCNFECPRHLGGQFEAWAEQICNGYSGICKSKTDNGPGLCVPVKK